MKVQWHPREGFQLLKQRITDGCTYATFAGKPISDKDALNMLLFVIARTILFARDYQEWHQQAAADKTLTNAFTWWAAKVRVMKNTTRSQEAWGAATNTECTPKTNKRKTGSSRTMSS